MEKEREKECFSVRRQCKKKRKKGKEKRIKS